jgi:hypothetical protein
MSPAQRQAAAQSAENKFTDIQNRAARLRAGERAARNLQQPPATRPADAITIAFTEDELNAFFDKWSVFQNWKAAYDRYLEDPVVILQDGRIILAGKVKELGLVASLHFAPKIDETGKLDLRLVQILGGRLPLPEAVIGRYQDRVIAHLAPRLAGWQRSSAFDASGSANSSAIAAVATMQLVHILRHEPAESIVFLPVLGEKGSVPVRVTNLRVEKGAMTLTVVPMTHDERAALLQRIRSGDGHALR